jgi:hydrogenase expression/formation protein HypC
MCLAVPGQVLTLTGESALTATGRVTFSGVVKEVSLALVPEIKVGDYVLVHAGFAITVLNELEARKSIGYLEELSSAYDQADQQT